MKTKIISTIAVIILGSLAIFFVLKYFSRIRVGSTAISPYILSLTQPVMSFTGVVEHIKGNTITVSQKQLHAAPLVPPAALAPQDPVTVQSPFPTPKSVTLTYMITVSEDTQLSRPSFPINYLFKTVPPEPLQALTLQDVSIGQVITVSSQQDLRTLSGNKFEATHISLPQKMTIISGTVMAIGTNKLTIKANAVNTALSAPETKEYTISITNDTEISRMSIGTTPKSERLAISDLNTDTRVTVYTDTDVAVGTEFTALRIEPMRPAIAVPPPPSATAPVAPQAPTSSP